MRVPESLAISLVCFAEMPFVGGGGGTAQAPLPQLQSGSVLSLWYMCDAARLSRQL